MPRFYTETTKENFLSKVKELLTSEDFPGDGLPKTIESDLKKVDFDWENFTGWGDRQNFATYPVGYRELNPGFHVYFMNCGGDWEFPICFILYWGDNKLRAYIPEDGNAWNKKEKCAYGSEDIGEMDNDDDDTDKFEKEISASKMIEEIINHITKKA